jgi:hypothetical protein
MSSTEGQNIPLQPISEYWTVVTDTCNNVKPVNNDTVIMFQLPAWPGHCHADLVTQKYSIQLENPGLTVTLAGWHSCNAGTIPNGIIEFRVHGIDSSGNDNIIATYTMANLTANPATFNVGSLSNYTQIYFEIYAYSLYYSGIPGLFCAFYLEPMYATITGTVPPANSYQNIEVIVKDSSNGNPIPNASVQFLTYDYNYFQTETTNNEGIATFDNVPFNEVASYQIIAKAKGYKSSSLNLSGTNLEQDNFQETIALAPSASSSKLPYIDYVYIAAGAAAAIAAGYLIYKYVGYENIKNKAKSAYSKVREKI